jgi:hypothetical protein
MPGGNKAIKPSDGKQFEKGNKAAEKWTEPEAMRFGNDLLAWMKEKDENVFFNDFIYISCDESKYPGTIYSGLTSYLSEKFSSFSKVLQKCREIEKTKLKKFGAFDKLNASIVKFLLSAEYGLTEKTLSEHTGPGGGPLIPKQTIDLSKLSKDDLRNLIELQSKAGTGTP